MKTHKFARKPFYVDAVRVTKTNMEEVAEWCGGKIETQGDAGRGEDETRFINVAAYRPLNDRQTQAHVGDWVLSAGTGFKVYTPKAFDKSFEKVKTLTKEQADEAGIKVPHEPRPTTVSAAFKRAEENKELKLQGEGKPFNKGPVPTAPKLSRREVADIGEAAREQGMPETKDEADRLIDEVLSQPHPSDQR